MAKSKQAVTLPEGAQRLYEADDAVSPRPTVKFGEAKGDKYLVRIISAGEGSSGIYPIEMLENDIPAALPSGSRMRANHDGLCEGGGDIRRVIARTVDTPWREGEDMLTHIQISEQWSPYVEEFGDIIGLSISMAGEYEDIPEGGEDIGHGKWVDAAGHEHKRVIAHLLPASESPYNSLDFVEAPGANGRILAAVEAARDHLGEMNLREQAAFASGVLERKTSAGTPPQSSKEDIEMDEATLRTILAEERAATVSAVEAKVAEARKPADEPPAPTLKDMTEAVVAAGLTDEGRDAVYEAVESGKPLADAIAREKKREESISAKLGAKADEDLELPVYGSLFEAGSVSEGDANQEFEKIVGAR